MNSSEATANVADALVKAALLLTNPVKDRTVSTKQYSYRYVDLATILDEVRPILQAHQLALLQEAAEGERGVAVSTRIVHASGEWIEFGPLVIPTAADAQAMGSAITYARRYQLLAALGIAADDDDDGAQASPGSTAHGPATTGTPAGNAAQGQRPGASSEAVGAPSASGTTSEGGAPTTPPSDTSLGGGDGAAAVGEAPAAATPSPGASLADLLEAVDGSEVRAINAVNKAMHTAYKKDELETLEPEDWDAGLRQIEGGP